MKTITPACFLFLLVLAACSSEQAQVVPTPQSQKQLPEPAAPQQEKLSEEEAQKRRSERAKKLFKFALDKAPKIAEPAPTFVLPTLDGKSETDLASFRGKMPLVLFFGSYT